MADAATSPDRAGRAVSMRREGRPASESASTIASAVQVAPAPGWAAVNSAIAWLTTFSLGARLGSSNSQTLSVPVLAPPSDGVDDGFEVDGAHAEREQQFAYKRERLINLRNDVAILTKVLNIGGRQFCKSRRVRQNSRDVR